jgi:glucokinase
MTDFTINWKTDKRDYESITLAGDIGGTNTNIAFVGHHNGNFEVIVECVFETQRLSSCVEAVRHTLKVVQAKCPDLKADKCCISAAGPVVENICTPSHIKWDINAYEINQLLKIPTMVINDFMAISYSLPLLDVNNPEQVLQLPHTTGLVSPQVGNMRAIVGAGTGLGTGFLIGQKGNYVACPSEAGHINFAGFDSETRRLKDFVGKIVDYYSPGVEPIVSGIGIVNIFRFFKEYKRIPITGVLEEIDQASDTNKPGLITKYASQNPICGDIVRLFIKLYGKFASNIAASLLPTVGLYLAGGIVTRTEKFFLEENLFMHYFEQNYNPVIREVLKAIPVYIIRDYSVSLYGAANAAHCAGKMPKGFSPEFVG